MHLGNMRMRMPNVCRSDDIPALFASLSVIMAMSFKSDAATSFPSEKYVCSPAS